MLHHRFGLWTFFETERVRTIDADYTRERLHETLERVRYMDGASGALALRSTRCGYVQAVRWYPGSMESHRSYHTGKRGFARAEDLYELMTFWNSEDERDAARDLMEGELLRVPVRLEFDQNVEIINLTGEDQ